MSAGRLQEKQERRASQLTPYQQWLASVRVGDDVALVFLDVKQRPIKTLVEVVRSVTPTSIHLAPGFWVSRETGKSHGGYTFIEPICEIPRPDDDSDHGTERVEGPYVKLRFVDFVWCAVLAGGLAFLAG